MIKIRVDSGYDGKKLVKLIFDKYLINFSGLSKFLKKKNIKLNNKRANISATLKNGDIIYINDFCEKFLANKKKTNRFAINNDIKTVNVELINKIKQTIIFENENLLAINKIKNISVQGGSGIITSIDNVLPYISNNSNENLHLVHRLDRDTTGVLIIGKGSINSQEIIDAFRQKKIKKYYLAICYGKFKQKIGVINEKLIKKYENSIEKVYVDNIIGKEAITKYKVLKYNKKLDISLVLIKILTGRTHQIRVHFKHISHPLVGDFKYNKKENGLISKSVLLHSYNIKINIFDKNYNIKAEPPKIFNTLFNDINKR